MCQAPRMGRALLGRNVREVQQMDIISTCLAGQQTSQPTWGGHAISTCRYSR